MIPINSTHHKILASLNKRGASTLGEIQDALGYSVSEGLRRSIGAVHLPGLEAKGFILQDDAKSYHLTAKGRAAVETLAARLPTPNSGVVKANLVSKLGGTYDGAELKREAKRPGSMDFLKYPSLINGKRVEYV
jgi:DNA-binding MarR family transcriptional regulator